jgi:hypothetical protein
VGGEKGLNEIQFTSKKCVSLHHWSHLIGFQSVFTWKIDQVVPTIFRTFRNHLAIITSENFINSWFINSETVEIKQYFRQGHH